MSVASELEQLTILCSCLSFPRKRESRPPAPRLWMPDHVRHDESGTAWLQPNVKRSNAWVCCSRLVLLRYISPSPTPSRSSCPRPIPKATQTTGGHAHRRDQRLQRGQGGGTKFDGLTLHSSFLSTNPAPHPSRQAGTKIFRSYSSSSWMSCWASCRFRWARTKLALSRTASSKARMASSRRPRRR